MTNRKKVHEVRLKWLGETEVVVRCLSPLPQMKGLFVVGDGKPDWEDRLATAGLEGDSGAFFRIWDDPELFGIRLLYQYKEIIGGTVLDAMREASEDIAQQLRDAGYEVRIEEVKK